MAEEVEMKSKRQAVSVEDNILFRIPFTVYWVGREGGYFRGLCLWRKIWDVERGEYFWDIV